MGLSLRFGQVCDEPHPLLVKEMIQHCVNADIDGAYKVRPALLNPEGPPPLEQGRAALPVPGSTGTAARCSWHGARS